MPVVEISDNGVFGKRYAGGFQGGAKMHAQLYFRLLARAITRVFIDHANDLAQSLFSKI